MTRIVPEKLKPQRKGEIVRQIGIYSASAYLTQLITLVAAILSRKFLGPLQMGIWATLQIVIEYSQYASFGTMHSVAREMPHHIGKGEPGKAEEIKNIVFTQLLIFSSTLAATIVLFALVTSSRFDTPITVGLILISGIVILRLISNLLIQLLRSYKDFALASQHMILSAIVNALLVGILTYYFKIYGFMIAMILSFIFNILFILLRRSIRFKWSWKPEKLKELIGFGMPLLVMGLMGTVVRSIDKIMIVRYLSFTSLGFYTIALMMATYLTTFLNSMAIVLIPHFQQRFAANKDIDALNLFLDKALNAYAMLIPLLIAAVWIVAPYFIELVLSEYTAGIQAMKYLVLGVYFLALTQALQDYLVTLKKHYRLFPILLLTFVLAIATNMYAIMNGYGIEGVAIATSVTFGLQFTVTYFVSHLSTKTFTGRMLARYFKMLLLGLYGFLSILISFNAIILPEVHPLAQAILRYIFFVLVYSPILWTLNKRFSLTEIVRRELKEHFGRKQCDSRRL
jgi:O-antigen/teichoic acid export membrane protein